MRPWVPWKDFKETNKHFHQFVIQHLLGAGEGTWWLKALAILQKGPGFDSMHLNCGSQPSVTPVPEHLMPSSALLGTRHSHGAHIYFYFLYNIQENIQKIKVNIFKRKRR